jgi:3-methyladenine DNA glycosylase AlkD
MFEVEDLNNDIKGSKTYEKRVGRLGMASVEEVLKKLKARARPDQLEGMARYGMVADRRLGVSVPDMRKIAKEYRKDHKLALELWKTGISEARIVAAMIDDPEKLTERQMEEWVKDINSWDICDQVCMNLFEKTPLAWKKILDWSEREEEFVKRTAFALTACLAWHNKEAEDEKFIKLFPEIKRGATDERNFVKKAVNWALRNIGKRNPNLNKVAIKAAKEIQRIDSKVARWIAYNAIRELESEAVQRRRKR